MDFNQLSHIDDKILSGQNNGNIKFIDQKILKKIKISEFQIQSLEISNCPNLDEIDISNQKGIDILSINDCKGLIKLKISEVSVVSIFLKENSIQNIEMYEVELSKIFLGNELIGDSLIIKCKNKSLRFEDIDLTSMDFRYMIFIGLQINTIELYDVKTSNFQVRRCVMNELIISPINLVKANGYPNIRLYNIEILQKIDILIEELDNFDNKKYIYISDLHLSGKGNITFSYAEEKLSKYYLSINKFNIYGSLEINSSLWKLPITCSIFSHSTDEGLLLLKNILFKRFDFTGFNIKASIVINQCSAEILSFFNFNNKGLLKFTRFLIKDLLIIENSDLNEVIFRPLNVINKNIQICDSSFLGGLKLFGSDIINLDNINHTKNIKQEYYRQLKQASKNSNNRFLELEYKAKEMEYYEPSQNTDKVVHWFNAINAYGLDWGWPMVVMGVFNFILWIPFATLLYSNHFGEFDLFYLCDTFGRLFKDFNFVYFQLLNPISRMSDFSNLKGFPSDVSWIVHFLFITSKVLNSVFIYQIVTAFRKWVGKE
jgi:hypothetical protein